MKSHNVNLRPSTFDSSCGVDLFNRGKLCYTFDDLTYDLAQIENEIINE
jgi:hypothetical protein